MLDSSTLYLIMAMTGFVSVAVVMIHQYNCSEVINRKHNEVENTCQQFAKKIELLEQGIVDLKVQIEELDEKLDTFQA